MKLADLKKLSRDQARDLYGMGALSRFEMMFRDYLNGDIAWPEYTAQDLIALRTRLGLTQEALALLLTVSPKTVMRWEASGETIPSMAGVLLCILDRLEDGFLDLANAKGGRYTLFQEMRDHIYDTGAEKKRLFQEEERPVPAVFYKEKVIALRKRLQLSKKELADLLHVSQSTVEKWESGVVVPKGTAHLMLKLLWVKGKDEISSLSL